MTAKKAEKEETKTASGQPMPLTVEQRLDILERKFDNHQHGRCGEVEIHEPKQPEPAAQPEGEETK